MADINSSLIGFLKKKSLFANSPEKNKKFRDQSREDKRTNQLQKSQKVMAYNPEQRVQQNLFNNSNKNLQKHSSVQHLATMDIQVASQSSMIVESPIRYESYSPQNQKQSPQRRNFHQEKREEPRLEQHQLPEDNTKNIWSGIISKAITFESARMESAQCLDNMTVKLQTQISSINYKIDAFRSKMSQILDQQFANLRDKINYMVERVMQESEANIKIYIKEQEKTLAADLVAMRESLIKQYQRIQVMKEEINKPNWRKIAGELLSSDLEEKVQEMLLKSKSINVKSWELRDLGDDRLPSLQRELRNVARLGPT